MSLSSNHIHPTAQAQLAIEASLPVQLRRRAVVVEPPDILLRKDEAAIVLHKDDRHKPGTVPALVILGARYGDELAEVELDGIDGCRALEHRAGLQGIFDRDGGAIHLDSEQGAYEINKARGMDAMEKE